MSVVATATTVETGHAHPSVNRPNLTSVGTIIWLSSELMFFAALFAMYFTLRSVTGAEHWKEMASALNFPFSATNTTILVLSSLTCQLGVFAAERGDVKKLRSWFVITFVMGAIFIGGQVFEYTELVKKDGLSLSSDPYGSAFYLTTGFHGLHVTAVSSPSCWSSAGRTQRGDSRTSRQPPPSSCPTTGTSSMSSGSASSPRST